MRSPRGGTRGRTGPHLQPPQTKLPLKGHSLFSTFSSAQHHLVHPPSFIDEPHHHLILTRCLVAVQLSTSLASATALVPATSPTNSNGNFDPSFLSPPTTQKASRPVQSNTVSRGLLHPPSRPRPRVEVFAMYIHRRVVPTVVPCFRPVPPIVPPHSIERSAMTERFQTNALGFAPGKSPVNGIHPASRRHLDAATRSQNFKRDLCPFRLV